MTKSTEFRPIEITPPTHIEFPNFNEVWDYKNLLFYLTKRDLKVRFQQTFIGVLWILLQPLIQMIIFTTIFGVLVRVPTGETPYSVFFLSGFVIWQFFSQVINTSAYSLVVNIGVILKIYFPKLTLPFSSVLSSLIDFVLSFLILLPLLLFNGYSISSRYLFIPILIVITTLFSSGVGMLFGALMVVFRDVKNLLTFILMIWMYLTPIMYPISLVPENYQFLVFLNPLTSLVETFRWVVLFSSSLPEWNHLLISFVVAVVIWILGAIAFKSMENIIADVM